MPANAYASVDSKLYPKIKSRSIPAWCIGVFILQIAIVYFFASMAKLYPDWLDGSFTGSLLHKFHQPWILWLTQSHKFHIFIAWGGILFDLLVVPALLYRKTRNIAAIASVGFHTFNFITLNIGIFPFLSLAYLVFFYPPETIRRLFLPKKLPLTGDELLEADTRGHTILRYFFIPYFIIQFALPVRHFFIKGDVIWTEEGHRLSWRMMLKRRKGTAIFVVKDKTAHNEFVYDTTKMLTKLQIKGMNNRPDMIWQTAQMIRKEYAKKGHNVEVYVTAKASVNDHKSRLLIDPKIDLAHIEWNHFAHNDWIILYNE